MVTVIRSDERYHMQNDWLDSHWHFAFDRYYDPNNIHFGALRVFNDDWVKPHTGFGEHPHREMEIVTYVIDGELSHQDSAGHKGLLRSGDMQCMTAGTGVVHSEFNHGDAPVHFLQIWFLPDQQGLRPEWHQVHLAVEDRLNQWRLAVGRALGNEGLSIHQDVSVYIARLQGDHALVHSFRERRGYFFVIQGSVNVNQHHLDTGDVMKLEEESALSIVAVEDSELIFIEMP